VTMPFIRIVFDVRDDAFGLEPAGDGIGRGLAGLDAGDQAVQVGD